MQIDYDHRKKVYDAAIAHWGADYQTLKAIEEMAELTKAISKDFYSVGGTTDELVDEIADVTIMMEQLRMIYGVDRAVQDRIDYKIRRLAGRLGMSGCGEECVGDDGDRDGARASGCGGSASAAGSNGGDPVDAAED